MARPMFDILLARMEKEYADRDKVGFWFVNEYKNLPHEALIYPVTPAQLLAAWIVTGIVPKAGGGFQSVHSVPDYLASKEMTMLFDIAKALIQMCEAQLLVDKTEGISARLDELRTVRAAVDARLAALIGSTFMGIAQERAELGLSTYMQLAFSPDKVLTVNNKWQSEQPEKAITNWGYENAQELHSAKRRDAQKKAAATKPPKRQK